jgi:hypothetical protein
VCVSVLFSFFPVFLVGAPPLHRRSASNSVVPGVCKFIRLMPHKRSNPILLLLLLVLLPRACVARARARRPR